MSEEKPGGASATKSEMDERRVSVQGDGPYMLPEHRWPKDRVREPTNKPGTIMWSEHVEVWDAYRLRHGDGQSANRIAERGGFSKAEAEQLIGRELRTWRPL